MALVAWWKLDGNALDSSGNGHHGSIIGTLPIVDNGKIGKTFGFANNENGISVTSTNLVGLEVYTMCAWVKPLGNHRNYNGTIISSGNWNSKAWAFGLSQNNSQIDVASYGYNRYISHPVPVGEWTHILCTAQNNITKVYVNGAYIGQVSTTSRLDSSASNLCIGRETYASGYFSFNGNINDVRVYDHILSEKEIKELAKAKILHYKFDDFQEPTENLLLNNLGPVVSSSYAIKDYPLRIPLIEGRVYTISMKATLGEGKSYFGIYNSGGSVSPTFLNSSHLGPDGVYRRTFTWSIGSSANTFLRVYHMPSSTVAESTIEWIQVEEKPYSTEYTTVVREGTVYDCSGYDNHATLALATTPRWTEDAKIGSGAYEFDGLKTGISYRGNILNSDSDYTFSCWFKWDGGGGGSDGRKFLAETVGGNYMVSVWIGTGLSPKITTASTLGAITGNTTIQKDKWYHVAVVLDQKTTPKTVRLYLDGLLDGTGVTSSQFTVSGLNIGTYRDFNNRWFSGLIDDVRLYTTALSDEDIKELYSNRVSLDDKGNLYTQEVIETRHKPLIADYTLWQDGQTGSVGAFSQNGTTAENYRILGYDPWGKETVIWEARPAGDATSDGGWNMNHGGIDPTKLYRYSVWAKRSVQGNGSFYLGTMANQVATLSGVTSSNPYFYSGGAIDSEWQLYVGHVHPHNYTGGMHPDSGRYKVGGRIGSISADFKWLPTATTGRHRSYLYYSSDTNTRQQWCYPRVDICDGTEPSIQELLDGFDSRYIDYVRAKGGANPITLDVGDQSSTFGTISELGPTNGLIAYYPLNGNANDYSGNNLHGTVYGAVPTAGIHGLAYSFDGVDDYIRKNGGFDFLDNSSATFSLWIKTSLLANRVVMETNKGNLGLHLQIMSDGEMVWGYNGTTFSNRARCGFSVADDKWHHIAGTFDYSSTYLELYIDGELTGTHNGVNDNPSGMSDLLLGGRAFFQGIMSDVRIYNRALTAEEVQILYNTTKPDRTPMQISSDGRVFVNKIIET